jgi:hypothetical protein
MMDLRIPTGIFFTMLGLIVVGMGVFSPGSQAALTNGANVNLYSGLIMLGFGALMLALAWRSARN